MTVAFVGTAANTATQTVSSPSTGPVNLPSGITSGEMLMIGVMLSDPGRTVSISGWTSPISFNTAGRSAWQIFVKLATGTEGATVDALPSGSATEFTCISCRLTGVDSTNPLLATPNYASGATANATNISIAASVLTGITTGNAAMTFLTTEATRTVTAYDADYEYEVGQNVSTRTTDFYLDTNPVSSNPQYDFTLNSARDMDYVVFEILASATGGFLTRNYWWDSY